MHVSSYLFRHTNSCRYTHACTHACVHLLMHMYTDICIHIYKNPCTHTNMYVHTTCIHTSTYIYKCAGIYTHTGIHTYTYVHIYAYTQAHCFVLHPKSAQYPIQIDPNLSRGWPCTCRSTHAHTSPVFTACQSSGLTGTLSSLAAPSS